MALEGQSLVLLPALRREHLYTASAAPCVVALLNLGGGTMHGTSTGRRWGFGLPVHTGFILPYIPLRACRSVPRMAATFEASPPPLWKQPLLYRRTVTH